MTEDIREAIVSIVRSITLGRDSIGDDSSLFHDLGIAGDDAAELFDKIHEKFGTRFDGLEFSTFFPDETEAIFYHVAKLFGYRSRKPELTLGHLVRVVEAGAWFAPDDPTVSVGR